MLPYDTISELYIKNFVKIIYQCSDEDITMYRDKDGYLYEVAVLIEGASDKSFVFFCSPSKTSTKNILDQVLNKANKINASLDKELKEYYRGQ